MTLYSYNKKATLLLFILGLFLSLAQVFALTNPTQKNSVVTATVPESRDSIAPTSPILISPENNALINDSTPTFIWQQSSDAVGVDHYQIYLDGELLFDGIPNYSISKSQYELVYDSVSGRYSLTPTSTINDGYRTWRIVAYDAAGNNNTSATWSFIIDTLAPNLIISSIGPIPTYISAQDIDSIPIDPIELEDNSPIFLGTNEATSSAQVTVSIPGESNQIINFISDENGDWSFQLGILPRDVIITLNFVITDQAGNISVITDLKIKIIQGYIVIPPTPEVTPEATPGLTPTPTPIINIPILPPEEIADKIAKEIIKTIPEPVTAVISQTPELAQGIIMKIIQAIGPVGTVITTAMIPLFSFFALLLQLGQRFSWQLILKILQALGLIPPQEPQGLVYDSDTNEPVAYALLTITSKNKELSEQIIETVVTNTNGIYQGIQLPKGEYFVSVSHQDYKFPTDKQKPSYLTIQEFYRGEAFEVSSDRAQQLFLIPVDKLIETEKKLSFKKFLRGILLRIRFADLFWPLFAISTIITIFYPTTINLVILLLYVLILIKKGVKSLKRPTISGYVRNTNESPVENAIVRINDPQKGGLVSLLSTNSKGYFSAFLEPNKYQIQISKNGFVWMKEGSQLGYEEIDVTKERASLNVIMKDVNEIYKEMTE